MSVQQQQLLGASCLASFSEAWLWLERLACVVLQQVQSLEGRVGHCVSADCCQRGVLLAALLWLHLNCGVHELSAVQAGALCAGMPFC